MNLDQWVKASLILEGHLYEVADMLTNSSPYFFLLESFKSFPQASFLHFLQSTTYCQSPLSKMQSWSCHSLPQKLLMAPCCF